MMTVKEVSDLAGVSIRTLQYYDKIGLLKPAGRTDSGYRLYDEADLEALQQILLFRELQFPLKEIKKILSSPQFNRQKALEQQIELLTLRKERLEKLIKFAKTIKSKGTCTMGFEAFDTSKLDDYALRAKAEWGEAEAFKEYESRARNWKPGDPNTFAKDFMQLFVEFGQLKDLPTSSPEAEAQVKKLQRYITDHFYTCTDEILEGLSHLYDAGGEFTANIDAAGGAGTADFTAQAMRAYCQKKKGAAAE